MVDLSVVKDALKAQQIETPSWNYGNSGARFKVSAQTGVAPLVSLHIPWDKVDDYQVLAAHAADLGVRNIREIDQSGSYCDTSQPYGCPAGTYQYYGRGPLQISWNLNYKAAGDALGVDLLDNPDQVASNAAISWQTALWYFTGTGTGSVTSRQAMVGGSGFGATIRAINDSSATAATAEMQDRVNNYESFTSILGVPADGNLTC